MGFTRVGLVVLALVGGASVLAGCTSPNTYATARTLSPGDVTHTVAVEGITYHGSQGTGFLPILPTYVFRVGVIDRVDIGARIGSLTEIGADLKVNFLRGTLDMAVAAGAEAFIEWHYLPDDEDPNHRRRTGSRAYFHFPLILSYNFSKTLSLVGTPGVTYIVGRKVSDDFVRTQPFDGGTLAARFGLGIDYRWAKRRAFHPEVTLLQSTQSSGTVVLLGLGFNFGSIPNYDDVEPSTPTTLPEPSSTKPTEQTPTTAKPPEPQPSPPPPPSQTPPPTPPPTPESPPSNRPIE